MNQKEFKQLKQTAMVLSALGGVISIVGLVLSVYIELNGDNFNG